jgi:CBS domain-containing protein
MPKVQEVMKKRTVSLSPSASLTEVARRIIDCEAGVVTVCEKGKLRGIITKENIVSRIATNDCDLRKQKAVSVMKNNVPKISPGVDITEAAKLMVNHNVQCMPVIQNGKLLGLLTLEDLLTESPALAVIVMTKQYESKSRRVAKAA